MKILIILLFCLVIILCVTSVIFYYKSKSLSLSVKRTETQILKLLRQLRYGQMNVNLETFKNEKIKQASEKLLEALKDREMMLQEYKHMLTEKNKSLEIMIAQEKESQQFKDDFVAALTHDLKTPVIAELNAINMLMDGMFGEISPSQKEVLAMMQKSDKELIELSEMLQQTYKYQSNEIVLQKERVEINSFICSIFDELLPIFNPKNQKAVCDLQDEKVFAEIDLFNFKRVLHNLLLNASKYGYKDTEIVLKMYENDGKIFISVSNTGDTINEKETNLIFEKYYSGINKFQQLSTGLGLYCANKIVTAHGGKIDVSSENGLTVFTVCIDKSA